jgi:hypothetical protein
MVIATVMGVMLLGTRLMYIKLSSQGDGFDVHTLEQGGIIYLVVASVIWCTKLKVVGTYLTTKVPLAWLLRGAEAWSQSEDACSIPHLSELRSWFLKKNPLDGEIGVRGFLSPEKVPSS